MQHVLFEQVKYLEDKAEYIRKQICYTAYKVDHVHLGGSLSATDVVVSLFYKYLNLDVKNLDDPNRNKFILSKGHCGVLLYNIFIDLGIYDWNTVFDNYNQPGYPFGQHPNRKAIKGIEASTGSLGHGLSLAVGMAISNKIDERTSRVFCLTGDGEMQEGTNWEAIMYAGSHHLSNLICIVDYNKCSSSFQQGDNIVFDWRKTFEGFGWNVIEIDGSDMLEIATTLEALPEVSFSQSDKPTVIISNTIKGQGVDFMYGSKWHVGSLNYEKLQEAEKYIESNRKKVIR